MTLTVISITRTSGSTRRVIGCHRDEPEANVRSIPPRRFASLAQSGFLVHKPERADLTFYRLGVRRLLAAAVGMRTATRCGGAAALR